jgi:hypothetical protein
MVIRADLNAGIGTVGFRLATAELRAPTLPIFETNVSSETQTILMSTRATVTWMECTQKMP